MYAPPPAPIDNGFDTSLNTTGSDSFNAAADAYNPPVSDFGSVVEQIPSSDFGYPEPTQIPANEYRSSEPTPGSATESDPLAIAAAQQSWPLMDEFDAKYAAEIEEKRIKEEALIKEVKNKAEAVL